MGTGKRVVVQVGGGDAAPEELGELDAVGDTVREHDAAAGQNDGVFGLLDGVL